MLLFRELGSVWRRASLGGFSTLVAGMGPDCAVGSGMRDDERVVRAGGRMLRV